MHLSVFLRASNFPAYLLGWSVVGEAGPLRFSKGGARPSSCDFFPADGFPNTEINMWQWLKGRQVMAKIIEFYVPKDFRKGARWVPAEKRGQVIEFYLPSKKSA